MLDSKGQMMGSDMTFEGDVEGSEIWYFDYKAGRLLRSESETTMEGTVALSGQSNFTIPISETENKTVQWIR